MSSITKVVIGSRTIELDKSKAEEAYRAKAVINGRDTPFFNLMPIKYQWAYDLYKVMKNNHWEPEDIQMQKDIEQWRGSDITDVERWIVKMAIGYFSAAEGIVGDNVLHVIRDTVTAPELKLLLGRHAHEENIHADSLVYMISSLGLNPHECEAIFEDVPSVKAKADFVVSNSRDLRGKAGTVYFRTTTGKQALAKNIFLFGQVMEGTQFYGLFAMLLGLYRQNKFPGIGQMFRYTLRDESNHIKGLRLLFLELVAENPDIMTAEFKVELLTTMEEGVALEKAFIRDCLPIAALGLNADEFERYIDYIADRRLASVGLPTYYDNMENPFPWMAEMIDIKKETNFFEGRVTEYQKASALDQAHDDEL
jgi:ribonucleoside-diphosphate reductase beta chain